jgi:PAS domain S-box-containing protein
MRLKLKIWLILGGLMLVLSGIAAWLDYREIDRYAEAQMRQQAQDLRAALMATRRVYHKQFLASGLPLNDSTLGFLPAHAMTRIAQDYPNWSHSGVRFNNVSDRPRNPANQADADELATMAWFRAHPKAAEYIGRLRDKNGEEFFHFSTPIWTESYCLACHSTPEAAPATIRERYTTGYNYHVGDLRGVLSIRIPVAAGREAGRAIWLREMQMQTALLLILLVTLGWLLNRFVVSRLSRLSEATHGMARGDYGTRVEEANPGAKADEIGDLALRFNAMAAVIAQREQVIKDSEQKYRVLADYSAHWEYWLGPDGRYIYVSPACAAVCGYPPEDFMADPALMDRLLHPDDLTAWREHYADVQTGVSLAEKRHVAMPLRIYDKAGQLRWIEHDCVAIYDEDGRYLGRRGVNRDIGERRRAEELERFSAFQAGIAEMGTSVLHNIGNAITAVTQDVERIDKTGAELDRVAFLLDDNADHSEAQLDSTRLADPNADCADLARRQCAIQHEAARVIRSLAGDDLRERSRRLGASVSHIADIVRIQQSAVLPSGQRSSFSLSQAIGAALEMQGDAFDKRGIVVSVTVDPALELVTLSHNLLLQALVNVFRNSIEAIDERAQSETVQGRLDIRAEKLGADRLRLSVEDNGIGFDPALRDSLFRFGFSTKARGTGFGLPSVAMFAHEAGGSVTLESAGRGQGARLVLELPLNRAQPQ